jgi:hypothetical protein
MSVYIIHGSIQIEKNLAAVIGTYIFFRPSNAMGICLSYICYPAFSFKQKILYLVYFSHDSCRI